MMIADLMRNDIFALCVPQSIRVEELWGVYDFPRVHQMTSTVSGELARPVSTSELFSHLHPAGSMTGAPKQRVCKAIAHYETVPRGWYSGAIGYRGAEVSDFNVCIRTLVWNRRTGYLRLHIGGAITRLSTAEEEWQECLTKAQSILAALPATLIE